MSSHSHVESGEKSKEKKADGNQHNPTPNPILTTQLAHFSVLPHGDVLKTAIPAGVKPLASRPIAPATGISVGTTTATAPKLLGVQGHHTTMPKALGLQQTCASGTQTAAVNLSTQTASSNVTGTQPLHIAMTSQSLQSLTPLPVMPALPQAGSMLQTQHFTQVSVTDDMLAKAHEDKEKSRIVMDQTRAPVPASSLMRGTIPQGLQQAQTQVNLTLAPNPGANQSHVSAIQTSINNTIPPAHIPRGAAAASALAAPKIGTNPTLRTSQTISTASHIQQPLLQTLSQSVQLRPLLRPSLPGPQILTTKVSGHHQTDIQRASAHILTSQSTIQGRPVHNQVQPAKSTLTSGQPVVQGFAAQPQKIVTQSQFLAPVTSGTTIVSVTTPKLTGQNIALNLTQTAGGATRAQKVIANQLPTLACGQANIPASLVAGGQTLSLNQSAPQSQKVGSQGALPPGAIVLNTATKQGVPGQRPPKVIMSHVPVTMATSTSIAVTTAAIPKSVFHGNIMTQGMTASTMMATTNIATPTLAKKALVKVPTQRPLPPHVALTTSSHTLEPLHRDMAIQGQTKPPLAQPPGHITQIQSHAPGQVQGNMFTIPATRPPLTNQAVVSLGMSAGQVTMQTETRPQTQDKTIRHGMPPYLSLSQQNCAPHSAVSYCQQQFNVIYQPTFTTGSTIRPSIVPGQPGNIAATLQAAPQGTPAVPPDVRILQPSLVKVDPVNANTITMAQFVAAKTSEAAAIVTTITTPVIQGTALSHQVGGALPPSSYGSGVANQQTGATVSQSTNASPRPSILRKRPHDSGVMIVKKNLLSSVNAVDVPQSQDMTPHVTPTVSPKPPPPVDPNRENSQSSTDTASSAESTPQSNLEARVKDEPMESAENADNVGGLALFGAINNNVEASPRKKPRKQRLEANHEMQDSCSSDEELDKLAKEDLKLEWKEDDMKEDEENKVEVREDIKEYVDEEGVRWTHERRRPPINLLNHYVCTWKTRNNHFLRYSDVKPKEERRPTVNELANQKGIHQKASGWKMYHLAAQLEELMDLERDVFSSMTVVQESIAPNHIAKNPTMEDDISMVHELTQGNIQRCQLVMDQLEEARVSMVKVLDHKQRIIDIINKHHSKRPVKKKERS